MGVGAGIFRTFIPPLVEDATDSLVSGAISLVLFVIQFLVDSEGHRRDNGEPTQPDLD